MEIYSERNGGGNEWYISWLMWRVRNLEKQQSDDGWERDSSSGLKLMCIEL
jgi:hypothetical protein